MGLTLKVAHILEACHSNGVKAIGPVLFIIPTYFICLGRKNFNFHLSKCEIKGLKEGRERNANMLLLNPGKTKFLTKVPADHFPEVRKSISNLSNNRWLKPGVHHAIGATRVSPHSEFGPICFTHQFLKGFVMGICN